MWSISFRALCVCACLYKRVSVFCPSCPSQYLLRNLFATLLSSVAGCCCWIIYSAAGHVHLKHAPFIYTFVSLYSSLYIYIYIDAVCVRLNLKHTDTHHASNLNTSSTHPPSSSLFSSHHLFTQLSPSSSYYSLFGADASDYIIRITAAAYFCLLLVLYVFVLPKRSSVRLSYLSLCCCCTVSISY